MSYPHFMHWKDLNKSFREGMHTRAVLSNVSAEFARGEFTAIVGRSGSGKSTLLNVVSGIERADSGAIWLDGLDLAALNEHQLTLFRRHKIGFVFQFFNLIPTLTVWENVMLPLDLTGIDGTEAAGRVLSLLENVGLADRRDSFPDRLSGGQQQRVAIARALVHDPMLVLADEPTGNLDGETGRQVLALLDNLTRRAGKNLVLATHSSESVARADRVLHLRDGALVEGREHG